ncbi:hypothetical protein PPERSA_11038 [Pseudocohnilembus persalinus]|uniref:EF-hand domain-containing protein n=1 Tax=Pseudocohnilembus persalinus TaxID=266149 RepID=A0A0V0QZ76_PSEPJ|nr:hypothetical protein PPERSA_11038 [Pseudocohnilembus persalinus]|eukprot:KRX07489.1 hypothetical protein PPERSA_11038 [Pseudocohnilembus persalinus]
MKKKTQKELLLEKFNKSLQKPPPKKISKQQKEELQKQKIEREKKLAQQREITSEEMIMQNQISTVEMATLQKVFATLCNVTPLQQYVENVKNTKSQFYSVNNLSQLNQDQIGQKNFFTGQDLMAVLNQLDYYPTQTEIDTYIWEINDLMTGRIYWYEFELMYRRCSLDTQAQEPTDLFIIIEFLMYLCKAEEADAHEEALNKKDKKAKKNIIFQDDVDDSSDSDKEEKNQYSSNINSRQR